MNTRTFNPASFLLTLALAIVLLMVVMLTSNSAEAAPPACTATATITDIAADAYGIPGGPVWPAGPMLMVGRDFGGNLRNIDFPFPAFGGLAPKHVCQAVLEFNMVDPMGPPRAVRAGQNAPGMYVVPPYMAGGALTTGINVLDVTPIVQNWVTGAVPFNIGLTEDVPGGPFLYHIESFEAGGFVPQLTISYAP